MNDQLAPLRQAFAEVDAADMGCPVRQLRASTKACPKCGATRRQSCFVLDNAHYNVVNVARRLIQEPS